MFLNEIHLRDPFIFADEASRRYYLFGTNCPEGLADLKPNFSYYYSEDLINWSGPEVAFEPADDFIGSRNFWAPEVHFYQGQYYLFISCKGDLGSHRASVILVSEQISGPYTPLTNQVITDPACECLDATFFVDAQGCPWVIYSKEWTQLYHGQIVAQELSADLTETISEEILLVDTRNVANLRLFRDPRANKEGYLTDAPCLYQVAGELHLLWSSYSDPAQGYRGGYTINLSKAKSSRMQGPWSESEIVFDYNIGHPSVFTTFSGQTMICAHNHDTLHGFERPVIIPLHEVIANVKE